jgi:hypothetical protein
MLKTLLATSALSLALLAAPISSIGPLATTGAAGLTTAHGFGIDLELGGDEDDGPTISLGGDDEDDDEGGWGDDDEDED